MQAPPGAYRDRIWLVVAVGAPLAVTAALVPFQEDVANTNAALLLVLLVVAVAAWSGRRLPGIIAAVSAGVWFDFFLTQPYQRLTIDDRADVETTVLLLLVGVAVSELAVWGRRQQADASRQAGYLAGIQEAVEATTDASTPGAVISSTCEQLTRLLGLRRCRFDLGRGATGGATEGTRPRMRPDGQVEIDGGVCDIEHFGLPTAQDIDLLVFGEGGYRGRFLLSAALGAYPSLAQRLAAVALADQVGARLSDARRGTPEDHDHRQDVPRSDQPGS